MKSIIEVTNLVNVRGTELLPDDTREQYRQKLARITLDSMVQFVGLLDAEGTVLEINHVALDAVGIKLSDVEGKPFWTTFWWQVSPEINQELRDSIRRAAQGEFVRWDTEIYGRASGRETIVIDASLMPVKDVTGKVVFITAEGRDITEKKAFEREIAKKNQDLQALLERVRDLDEIKTQFFANVSHELRTPLQLIIGPADRLNHSDGTMSIEQRQESARVISRNARMLLKHVNDLLDISKFEAGKLKIELKDTDFAALLRLTASHFEVLAADRKITFRIEASASVSAVDHEKTQRVVMNLLSNAFKFVPDGGTIEVKLRSSSKDLTLSVEDSGPGVKPELRKAIFERFRQGEGGMNRQFGGTGLGLAIAKEFVEMHQGTLEVLDSHLGGACFQMTLPLKRLGEGAASSSPATNHLDRTIMEGVIEELRPVPLHKNKNKSANYFGSKKPIVLVVEDNPDMNRFVVECLSPEYNVVTAFDGQEGFEKALEFNPALIVTDIMMPKVSGAEMVDEIRKCPNLADVPILLLSAKADEELKNKLLDGGAQDFVAKPFSEKELAVRIKNLIELKKAQERHRTLFRSMDEGFCTIEVIFDEQENPVDYRFLEINDAFEKQTGLKDARGRRVREVLPNLEQHWFEVYGKVALSGESVRFENRADPLGRWFEGYAFRVGRPETRQVAIFFNDITKQKQAELSLSETREQLAEANQRLAKSNEELEQRVAQRTASLSEAIAQMEEFSYTVSHDLRAPLRGMQAYSEVLLEECSGLLAAKPEAMDYLKRIAYNAVRLDRMVKDVLTYSRMARNEFRLERVSIDQLVRGLIEHYPAMRPPNAEIHVEPLASVLGHETSLTQVISNMLTNAVKFMPPGRKPKIRVWTESRGEDVRLWVEDNGIGIAPKLQHRLFQMFERIHPDLNYEGTGVGLAVVRKAAERMNGKVGAESDGSNGSRFWLQLRGA